MQNAQKMAQLLKQNIGKVVVGKEDAVELMLIALLCRGHILIEDVPGVGKTTLASALARSLGVSISKAKCKALVAETRIGSERVVLAQPQTFMNLSGESVVQLLNWSKAEPSQLSLVYDDVDLPEGKLRFRPSGSAGTHNGMRNIIYLLGRDDFPRVRVGIGRPAPGWDMKDWRPTIPPSFARTCSTPI